MSGRPCWSLLPMIQRAAVDLEQHRRAGARDVGAAGRCRGGAGAVPSSTYWMLRIALHAAPLEQNGSTTRPADAPARRLERGSRSASHAGRARRAARRRTPRSVRSAPARIDASPTHDTSVSASADPARPRVERAEQHEARP